MTSPLLPPNVLPQGPVNHLNPWSTAPGTPIGGFPMPYRPPPINDKGPPVAQVMPGALGQAPAPGSMPGKPILLPPQVMPGTPPAPRPSQIPPQRTALIRSIMARTGAPSSAAPQARLANPAGAPKVGGRMGPLFKPPGG